MSQTIVEAAWNDQGGWSQTANRLKSRIVYWRTTVLCLTVGGAALQTLAGNLDRPVSTYVAALATCALTLVPFLTSNFLTAEKTRNWLRARSVSEGIKSEVYKFRAAAGPYAGAMAADALQKKAAEIAKWGEDIALERALTGSVVKPPPPALTQDEYIQVRLQSQIDSYYTPNAKRNALLSQRFRAAQIALAAVAAVLSAMATFKGFASDGVITGATAANLHSGIGAWVAVLTTIGGALAAHAAASHYDFQSTTFYATARQLKDLALSWKPGGTGQQSWSDFVDACENAISAENRGWMAKLDHHE